MDYIQNGPIPKHHAKRLEAMNQLREHNQMCDVAIVTNGRKFNAHKIVLSAASPIFLKMFTLAMMEADMKEIVIREIDSETINLIIQYIYTDKLGISSETAQNILVAANFLQMGDLVELCGNYIVEKIDETNCFEMKVLLIESNCNDRIVAKATGYINDKFLRISRNESFLRLDVNEVVELLSSLMFTVNRKKMCIAVQSDGWKLIAIANDMHNSNKTIDFTANYLFSRIFDCIRIPLLPFLFEREYFDNISINKADNSSNYDTLRRFKNSILVYCHLQSIAHVYDPFAKQWSKTIDIKNKSHELIASHNDEIHLPSIEGEKNVVDVFNLREKEWRRLPTPPFTNHGEIHALLFVADKLYLFDYDCEVSKVYVYDLKQKVWSSQPDIEADDLQLVAIDKYIYVFSTVDDESIFQKNFVFQRFDTETQIWVEIQPVKYAKSLSSVAEFKGKIYYVGTIHQSAITVDVYDPARNEWKEVAPTITSTLTLRKLVATIEGLYAVFQDESARTVIVESYDVDKDEWSVESETDNVLGGMVESACVVPNCYF